MSLIYAQLTHAIGLNDICDGLRLHNGPLVTLRGATPPSRNNLSHANKGIREITSRYQGRSRHRFGGLPFRNRQQLASDSFVISIIKWYQYPEFRQRVRGNFVCDLAVGAKLLLHA
jgi:hypothetical protein